MLPRFGINKTVASLLFLTTLITAPAIAHDVETSQDVGATFHIEPNDAPRANKPQLAWFALTQKGGKVIPLKQCNCKLAVYAEPHQEGSPPLLEPPLKEISIKRYQGIPGAEIVFPKAGAYELELSGTPIAGATFKPFDLSYEVTVLPGAAAQMSQNNSQAVSPNQKKGLPSLVTRKRLFSLTLSCANNESAHTERRPTTNIFFFMTG